jgi:hypothetical protein
MPGRRLTKKERDAALRLFLRGESKPSIANLMGCSERTIRNIAQREGWGKCLEQVREKVKEEWIDDATVWRQSEIERIQRLQSALEAGAMKEEVGVKCKEAALTALITASKRVGELKQYEKESQAPVIIFNLPRPEEEAVSPRLVAVNPPGPVALNANDESED